MAPVEQSVRASIAHPLDPLNEAEVALASDILRTEKQLGPDTRFTHIQLEEPAKSDVLAQQPNANLSRRAAATLFDCKTGVTHIATVDLGARQITAWREHLTKVHPYGQPPVTLEEVFKVGDIVKADSGWRGAMKRRGLSDAGDRAGPGRSVLRGLFRSRGGERASARQRGFLLAQGRQG